MAPRFETVASRLSRSSSPGSARAITLATTTSSASIDLGGGSDTLTLGNFVNKLSVANVETVIGGSGYDTVTLSTALGSAMSIDLGAGNNALTLAAGGGNTGTVSNVASLVGSSGVDAITYATAVTNASINLGTGNDTLQLTDQANTVSVSNTETIFGCSGADTIVLTGTMAATVVGGGGINFITGGGGGDTFVLDQASAGNYTAVKNFGVGDKIGLDVAGVSSFTADPYDLGGASLAEGTTIMKAADASGRLAAALNGGKGAFVYQQDTGALYYAATGDFSGGGTEIGVITATGTTPWSYDAAKFIAV